MSEEKEDAIQLIRVFKYFFEKLCKDMNIRYLDEVCDDKHGSFVYDQRFWDYYIWKDNRDYRNYTDFYFINVKLPGNPFMYDDCYNIYGDLDLSSRGMRELNDTIADKIWRSSKSIYKINHRYNAEKNRLDMTFILEERGLCINVIFKNYLSQGKIGELETEEQLINRINDLKRKRSREESIHVEEKKNDE